MSRREPRGMPRYEEIAVDIARKIVDRELQEGERVLGRSSLAGTYKVSPETIRRAIAILHDRDIVRAVPGSGIRIVSRQHAMEFLEGLRTSGVVEQLQEELDTLIGRRHVLDREIENTLDRLVQLAQRTVAAVRRIDEVIISDHSWLKGQSLRSGRIRNLTGATIIAVIRGTDEFFSPGPDFHLEAGDLLMAVGTDAARERLQRLVEQPHPPAEA